VCISLATPAAAQYECSPLTGACVPASPAAVVRAAVNCHRRAIAVAAVAEAVSE